MSNNTLPEELAKEIQRKAEQYSIVEWGDPAKFPIGDAIHVRRGNSQEDYIAGATEYATKCIEERQLRAHYEMENDILTDRCNALQSNADRMEKALSEILKQETYYDVIELAAEALKEGGEDA